MRTVVEVVKCDVCSKEADIHTYAVTDGDTATVFDLCRRHAGPFIKLLKAGGEPGRLSDLGDRVLSDDEVRVLAKARDVMP